MSTNRALEKIPTALTWFRIALIPVFVGVFYVPWFSPFQRDILAMILFVSAALTDWLDGFLARRFNVTSDFGAFLDPVADKLIVSSALVLLVDIGRVSALFAMIIIAREIAISAFREWMATVGTSVRVAFLGKLKTTSQMLAIAFLLYFRPVDILGFNLDIGLIGEVLMILAVVLTIWSMFFYLEKVIRDNH